MVDELNNHETPKLRSRRCRSVKLWRRGTGNLCTLCVEYICDTYDVRCGLNLQTDFGYIADYKVVENLRQTEPNVISEVLLTNS